MRKIAILVLILSLSSFITEAQEVFEGRQFVLNNIYSAGQSYHYMALDSINLEHGFLFNASEGDSLKLEISQKILVPPSYGRDDAAPSDITIGSGMPYTLAMVTDVNDNGAAVIDIPIECPKGINGFLPQMSFVYNSQAGDGIMGVGWSIAGLSKISRVPYTYHYSDYTNAVTFTNSDDFSLDGNRLVKGDDGIYYPEIFDNSTISYSEDNGFTINKPNGHTYRYGKTDESRYYINGINKPIEWHIEEIEDQYGNKINFYYNNDVSEGSFYPEKVVYGGDKKYEIVFEYYPNNRNNTQRKYFSTSAQVGFSKINKLLREIKFYYDNDASWFQKYTLSYSNSGEFPKSELLLIEKYGSNNTGRAANKYCNSQFIWKNTERVLQKDVISEPLYTGKTYSDNSDLWCQNKVISARFNHNSSVALTDIVHLLENEIHPFYYMNVYINQSSNDNILHESDYMFQNNVDIVDVNNFLADVYNITHFSSIDIDGDGYNEILCINKDNQSKNHVNIIRYDECNNKFTIATDVVHPINDTDIPYEFYIGDYDGNGCSDIFIINGNNVAIYLSVDGTFNNRITSNTQLYYDNIKHEIIVGDFNGDGRDQIMCLCNNSLNNNCSVTLIKINKVQQDYSISCSTITNNEFAKYRFGTDGYNKCVHLCTGDLNGDNKQDLLVIMRRTDNHNWYFYLSKGNGKFTEKISCDTIIDGDFPTNEDICENSIPVMADYNNDGYTDLGITYVKKNVPFYEPQGQLNYSRDYNLFYRYEYLIRVDDSPKIMKKRLVDNVDNEIFIDSIRSHTTGIYRDNMILSCVGNFRGTSHSEVLYVKLSFKYTPNRTLISKFVNVGSFDNPHMQAISEAINGLGVKTMFDYVQHTYQGSYDYLRETNTSTFPPQTTIYTGFLNVVNKMHKETNQGKYKTTKYNFSKPIFHIRGKGLLGFTNASKIDDTQLSNIKIVTSKQFVLDTNYFMLYPDNIKIYTSNGSSFGQVSDICFSHESKKLTAYPNMPDKVFFPYQKEIFVKNYHNSTFYKTTINNIDSYGNPTKITQNNGNSESNMPYSETINISYVNKTEPKRIIGLVSNRTTVYRNYNTNQPVTYKEQYQYNDKGLVTYSSNKGITSTYKHDNFGNITQISRTSGNINRKETKAYSSDGRLLIRSTNHLYHTTNYSYYENKALLRGVKDPNGLVTTYNYDILDKIKSIEYHDETKEEFVRRWVGTGWHNDNSDHPDVPESGEAVYYTWSKKNGQNEITTFYDQHERKIRTVVKDMDENKVYTDYIYYNISGLLWKESLPYYKSKGETPQYTIYEYDIHDRIKTITKPDGSKQTNNYNGNIQTITNFDGQQKTITYLPAGKPQKINDNGTTEVFYEYFGDGNIKSTIINNNENTRVTYTYDSNGFLSSMNDPSLGKRTYSYNAFGELMSETNADSLSTRYTYDELGRMTRRTDSDGTTSWNYDVQKKGFLDYSTYEPINTDAPSVFETYIYDKYGRVTKQTQSIGEEYNVLTFEYAYNELGLQSSITYPSGLCVSNNYNYDGFMTSIKNESTKNMLWEANSTDRFGNVNNYILGNHIYVTNTYDDITGLVVSQKTIDKNLMASIQDVTYQWDTKGNLTNRSNTINGNYEDFQYDSYNRLTGININGNVTYSINFDNKGNITYKTDVGNMLYGSGNPYSLVKISEMPDLTLFSENQNVTYTSFDKVSSITQGTKRLDIYYGADRQRVFHSVKHDEMTDESHKRFFTNLYEETSRGDDIKKLHYLTSPSGLFAIFVIDNDTSTMSYVLKDHLGSMYATVTNGSVDYYSFDAWGRERNPNTFLYDNVPSHSFSRGFCMHEHYRDFGLINMNGRMYDPLVGRMLSPDIVIQNPEYSQSYNRYSYCFNNPLRFTDPSGYVVRGRNDVLNPQYFIWLKSSNSKNGNSFNTDIVEGSPSPIYDEDGNFLGTDDEGLQGDAIVMNINDFVQGMSHEDALALSTSLNENNLEMAQLKMNTHYSNLKNRPDWDGYLTKREADEWWKNGNGEALYVDIDKIDLSGIVSLGERFVYQTKSFNLLVHSASLDDGLVYGHITLKRYPNHKVRAYSDRYDFEMHSWKNPLNYLRNIETMIGKMVSGNGNSYEINIYGETELRPILPWIK